MDMTKAFELLLPTTASSQTLVLFSNVAVWSPGMIIEQSVSSRDFPPRKCSLGLCVSQQDEVPNPITLDSVSHTRIGRSRYLESYTEVCVKSPGGQAFCAKILDSVSPGRLPRQWGQNFGSAPKPGVTAPIRRHKVPLRFKGQFH